MAVPAQGDFSIAASPALLDLESAPGSNELRKVHVRNTGVDAIAIRSYVWDWQIGENGEKHFAPPAGLPNSLAGDIQVAPRTATIKPGEEKVFDILIATPKTAEGSRYAVVFFESVPPVQEFQEKEKALRVRARVGTLVMQRIQGRSKPELRVKAFEVMPPSNEAPLSIRWTIRNHGNAYTLPKCQVAILNATKELVTTLTAENGRVFPDHSKSYEVSSPVNLAPGQYTAILSIEFDASVVTHSSTFKVP